MAKQRALTGIKPTEAPHVGNWLGMLRPALALQEAFDAYYFIASYHALTTLHDAAQMKEHTLDVAATWLALGLDPARTVLFRQQDVPEVTELAWLLGCVANKSMLDKAHAFKDAVAKGKEPNVGLYTYPVLMAADILAFDSHVVPVGKDQKQHVEMARDIAQRFNRTFGDTFVVPEPLIRDEVAVVPGIDGEKMSKSYGNHIPVFTSARNLRKLIMKVITDAKGMEESKDPDTCNVFKLYKLVASREQTEDLAARYRAGGLGYGHAKQELFEVLDALLTEPRARYEELRADPDHIEQVLAEGAVRARKVARAATGRARQNMGL